MLAIKPLSQSELRSIAQTIGKEIRLAVDMEKLWIEIRRLKRIADETAWFVRLISKPWTFFFRKFRKPLGSTGQIEPTEEQSRFKWVKFSLSEINDIMSKHANRTLERIGEGEPPQLLHTYAAFDDFVDSFVTRTGCVRYIGDLEYMVQMPLSWSK